MLVISSSGSTVKVIRASRQSSSSMITTTPTRVSMFEKRVTMPWLISWLSASMSLVRRDIRVPGRLRVKKPTDILWMCRKTSSRRSWSTRTPTQPTR